MDDKDKDLDSALNDIFGSDFIEINTNNADELLIEQNKEVNEKTDEHLNDSIEKDDIFDVQNDTTINNQTQSDEYENNEIDMEVEIKNSNNENTEKENLSSKKIILYFVIGFVLGLILIFIIINYVYGITRVVNCSNVAEDIGYKYTDEYKITYKKNKITYLESTYTYTALSDEYKNQVEYVKKEKLPVVVNTNGMSGFTYTYEISDNSFRVNGYLDFELINFKKIDKINQDLIPISFVKLNSKTTFKSLESELKKEGFKCVSTK